MKRILSELASAAVIALLFLFVLWSFFVAQQCSKCLGLNRSGHFFACNLCRSIPVMFTLSALSSHRVRSIPVVFPLSVATKISRQLAALPQPIPVVYTLSALSHFITTQLNQYQQHSRFLRWLEFRGKLPHYFSSVRLRRCFKELHFERNYFACCAVNKPRGHSQISWFWYRYDWVLGKVRYCIYYIYFVLCFYQLLLLLSLRSCAVCEETLWVFPVELLYNAENSSVCHCTPCGLVEAGVVVFRASQTALAAQHLHTPNLTWHSTFSKKRHHVLKLHCTLDNALHTVYAVYFISTTNEDRTI